MVSALNVMVAAALVRCIWLAWPCLRTPPRRQSHTKEDWGGLGRTGEDWGPSSSPQTPTSAVGARPGCAARAGHLLLSLLLQPQPPGAVLAARGWSGTVPGRGGLRLGRGGHILLGAGQGCCTCPSKAAKSDDPGKHLANDACKNQASGEMMLAEKESAEEAGCSVRPRRGGAPSHGEGGLLLP